MKKYLVFIGTFVLSFIGAGIFLIGIMKLIDDANPGFINNPPSIVGMFIIFLAIPSLIAYYMAFEFKKSKKMAGLGLELGSGVEVEKPQNQKKESHWLFALIATFVIGGIIIGLLVIFPPIHWAPYSFIGVDDSEFQKIPTPSVVFNDNLSSESGVEASKSAEITNWKTYTNAKFTFKYPTEWTTDSIDAKLTGDIVRLVFVESNKEYRFIVASGGRGGPEAEKLENQTVQFDEKRFNRRTWIDGGKPFFISFAPDEAGFELFNHIEISLPPTKTDKYIKIFDQILSTFKFTN